MRRFTSTPLAANAAVASLRTLYSALVEDHYNNPRNMGKLDKTDPNVGTGLRGAPECGDMTQMQVKVNPDTGVIEDVKFKAFGCGSAIAASSYASQAIRGKTWSEALKLTNKKIAEELSLPPVKLHCSMLAQETIQAAVENYLSKNPSLKSKVQKKQSTEASTP
ncbi:putative iron-sulfur cluster assembly protein [Trypanosoma cruzi]|uniref:Iron-sulfur cluster assembly protein, putative n=3 Tax=Trypanosoma cruzi TaxID=5693 RepID=Q4DC04_TRYCC|nr:iron-sulfur cluster assembly protein, putative [Trypanosoma cruzi]XP_813134.1 iron-sulfur cluster assembly protein, putative [Trypanosoma cruzi]ESS71204.1 iron-sulfur cluster assembly protein [Trypanosoma cruzi Dm28c]PBJ73258.1 iron-sulfur cluster assembly protein [Trypanosoma cruzi cruzi]EAN90060.1 iron-sulfur cluster assembly protein, putative [Trypanosoma cruzi]EAN91283.1 iron-sulfur cluster assembly protein, putative [Trypanosoma cruzi]KAF8283740.1 putative iron-sulfur cluster assembly|eukprot:XP_811911.1 iron-sulfur cluster assembly protein [Trypanosoma cruzi strain CL Brener]